MQNAKAKSIRYELLGYKQNNKRKKGHTNLELFFIIKFLVKE